MGTRIRRTFARDREGAVAVMTALLMPVLVGFMGLGVEYGHWVVEKRQLQTAADAAALAVQAELLLHPSASTTQLQAVALQEANRGGLVFSASDVVVNQPPTSGAFTATAGAVEIKVNHSETRLFSGQYLSGAQLLSARAVTLPGSTSTSSSASTTAPLDVACFATLGKIKIQNSTTVNNSSCGFRSNSISNDSDAILSGSTVKGQVVSAGGMALDDGYGGTHYYTTYNPANTAEMKDIAYTMGTGAVPVFNAPQFTDPIAANVSVPTSPTGTACTAKIYGSYQGKTYTASSPLVLKSTDVLNVNSGDKVVIMGGSCLGSGLNAAGGQVTFDSTTSGASPYVFVNGSQFNVSGNLDSTGVTLITKVTSTVNISNGSVTFGGTSTGPTAGIAFYNAGTAAINMGNGAVIDVEGAFYSPKGDITIQGGGNKVTLQSQSNCAQFISNNLYMTNVQINMAGDIGAACTTKNAKTMVSMPGVTSTSTTAVTSVIKLVE